MDSPLKLSLEALKKKVSENQYQWFLKKIGKKGLYPSTAILEETQKENEDRCDKIVCSILSFLSAYHSMTDEQFKIIAYQTIKNHRNTSMLNYLLKEYRLFNDSDFMDQLLSNRAQYTLLFTFLNWFHNFPSNGYKFKSILISEAIQVKDHPNESSLSLFVAKIPKNLCETEKDFENLIKTISSIQNQSILNNLPRVLKKAALLQKSIGCKNITSDFIIPLCSLTNIDTALHQIQNLQEQITIYPEIQKLVKNAFSTILGQIIGETSNEKLTKIIWVAKQIPEYFLKYHLPKLKKIINFSCGELETNTLAQMNLLALMMLIDNFSYTPYFYSQSQTDKFITFQAVLIEFFCLQNHKNPIELAVMLMDFRYQNSDNLRNVYKIQCVKDMTFYNLSKLQPFYNKLSGFSWITALISPNRPSLYRENIYLLDKGILDPKIHDLIYDYVDKKSENSLINSKTPSNNDDFYARNMSLINAIILLNEQSLIENKFGYTYINYILLSFLQSSPEAWAREFITLHQARKIALLDEWLPIINQKDKTLHPPQKLNALLKFLNDHQLLTTKWVDKVACNPKAEADVNAMICLKANSKIALYADVESLYDEIFEQADSLLWCQELIKFITASNFDETTLKNSNLSLHGNTSYQQLMCINILMHHSVSCNDALDMVTHCQDLEGLEKLFRVLHLTSMLDDTTYVQYHSAFRDMPNKKEKALALDKLQQNKKHEHDLESIFQILALPLPEATTSACALAL